MIRELTNIFASSPGICMHNFLCFAMSPLLAFLNFYQTRSKGVIAVRFSLGLFSVVVFTVCLLVSYGTADNAYGSLCLEECNFTYF